MGVDRNTLPKWSDIKFLPAQLANRPLLDEEEVATQVIIGPKAKKPLSLDIPLFVSDMSFGALSREAKIALSKGAEMAGTGICSGEGGMLPQEQENNKKYFYELASAQFGFSWDKLDHVQAFHFKGGQGAKTGTGGHLPGIKILVDGIPETTPDGQGQIDNLNLGIIKNIEVMKGPAASLYGNASGGVISIYTLDNFDKSYINAGMSFGSYQFQQFQSSVGFNSGKNSFIIQGTKTNTDGYRVQSGFKNDNINLRMRHLFSDNTSLNVHIIILTAHMREMQVV